MIGSLLLLLPEMARMMVPRALMKGRTRSSKELTTTGLKVVAEMAVQIARKETGSKRVEEVEKTSPNLATLVNQNLLL